MHLADGEAVCLYLPNLRGLEPHVWLQLRRDPIDLSCHASSLPCVFLVHQLSQLVEFGQLFLREASAQLADALEALPFSVVGGHQVRAVESCA